jgi:predicted Fe-Mo cluster-binding NifX family protein
MKIAVSSDGKDLESQIDERFGRCPYFIIVDPDSMHFEVLDNSSTISPGGAGIAAAQLIAGYGVDAVLTGSCGPNAFEALSAAGITTITGLSGKIRTLIDNYKSGKYKASDHPNVTSHSGMGQGRGRRPGMGFSDGS